jgi:hypothetical protein
MRSRWRHSFVIAAALLAFTGLLAAAYSSTRAASGRGDSPAAPAALLVQETSAPALETPSPLPPNFQSISNDTCLSCHSNSNLTMKLDNGELLNLFISPDVYNHSIHGDKGYACVQCHTTVGNYPHPAFNAADRRDVSLKLFPLCQRCHALQSQQAKDSVHAAAQASGNRNAAVCTDCHTAHAVRQLTDPQSGKLLPSTRVWIPQTCAQCHYAIYQKYSTSVHGAALLGQGNPDVPTCIDCHGVHSIENPTTAAFRLKSPQICARCHTDPNIMDKYGISTQVLNTYVADFHGTTINIFEKESPDAQTNKPVCYDCHGVHDIQNVNDPVKGLAVKENLLARCQVCHPGATANFPTAWLSHYIPSPEKTPAVYFVNLFYKFFIPGVLGSMAILVVLDISSVLRKRSGFLSRLRLKPRAVPEAVPADPQTSEPQPAEAAPDESQPALPIEAPAEEPPEQEEAVSLPPESPEPDEPTGIAPENSEAGEEEDHD